MRKLLDATFRGPMVRVLARAIIISAKSASAMPPGMAQNLLDDADDPITRMGSAGIAVWAMRHHFRFGHRASTVNPVGRCHTLEDVRYCVELIEKSNSSEGIGELSLEILLSLKQKLNDADALDMPGTMSERTSIVAKINALSLDQLQRMSKPSTRLQKRTLCELKGLPASHPDVLALVQTSISEAIKSRLVELDSSYSENRAPVDIVTAINFQLTAGRSGHQLFVCGASLRALINNGVLYTNERSVHLGLVADADAFEQFQQWAAASLEYQVGESADPRNLLVLQFEIGTKLVIWRHQKTGGYLVRRDGIHIWHNLEFAVGEFALGNIVFNVPENWDQYLVESFGHNWRVPKLIELGTSNQANVSFDKGHQSLEYVTTEAVNGLSESRRLHVTYAFQDLADYFDIDYMPYLPVEDFYVETPAGRKRKSQQAEKLQSDTAYILCAGERSPSADKLVALEHLRTRYSRLVAIVFPVKSRKPSAQSAIFSSLKALDEVCRLEVLETRVSAQAAIEIPPLYNFDLDAAQIDALPKGLPAPAKLASATRLGA